MYSVPRRGRVWGKAQRSPRGAGSRGRAPGKFEVFLIEITISEVFSEAPGVNQNAEI